MSGIDDTDKTTYLAKDKTYGKTHHTRAPILHQIEKPSGTRGQEATGYLMDQGLVVLDLFDH